MKTKLILTIIVLVFVCGCNGQNEKSYSELLNFEENPFNSERNKWEINTDSISRVKTIFSKYDSTEDGLIKTVELEFRYRKERVSLYLESQPNSEQLAFVELDRNIEFYTWDNKNPEDTVFLKTITKLLKKWFISLNKNPLVFPSDF